MDLDEVVLFLEDVKDLKDGDTIILTKQSSTYEWEIKAAPRATKKKNKVKEEKKPETKEKTNKMLTPVPEYPTNNLTAKSTSATPKIKLQFTPSSSSSTELDSGDGKKRKSTYNSTTTMLSSKATKTTKHEPSEKEKMEKLMKAELEKRKAARAKAERKNNKNDDRKPAPRTRNNRSTPRYNLYVEDDGYEHVDNEFSQAMDIMKATTAGETP